MHRAREEGSVHRGLGALCAVLALVQGWFLISGYRLSADDIHAFGHALQGMDAVMQQAAVLAEGHGRIGMYGIYPLNALGAFLAGSIWFRVIYTGLYLAILAMFAAWVQTVVRARIAPFLLLMLLALHPLDYLHLSPNAYPLQNTVPFLLFFTARLAIRRARSGAGDRPAPLWAEATCSAVLALALVATEYAFLLGTISLAFEYGATLVERGLGCGIRKLLSSRPLWIDFGVTFGVFVAYASWRLAYPSQYFGNVGFGFVDPSAGVTTLLGHMFGLHLWPLQTVPFSLMKLDEPAWAFAALLGLAVASGLYGSRAQIARIPHWPWLASGGLVLALYVTLPVAGTERQQEWCTTHDICMFLDSRTAYLGVSATLGGLMVAVLRARPSATWRNRSAMALAVLIGAWTAATVLHNMRMAKDMADLMTVWPRADALACTDYEALEAHELIAAIEPDRKIFMHADTPRDSFWRLYLRDRARRCEAREPR